MLHPMALDRILVARRFAWPNQFVGFLLPYVMTYVCCHSLVVHHKVSGLYVSRTV